LNASASAPAELLPLYARMLLIRRFESALEAEYATGELAGTFHSSVGQEAVAVGVTAALEPRDWVVSNHRGHGHFLARGGAAAELAAELFGRTSGVCRGRGGTQHLASRRLRFLANGIAGGGLPVAAGLALAEKLAASGALAGCFFGDGAANTGAAHEALNLAAAWRLPVLFVCENNGWAMGTRPELVSGEPEIWRRGAAYRIPAAVVDGNDLEAVLSAARAAVARVRAGEGPQLLECRTYRLRGHSKSDRAAYRPAAELAAAESREPLRRLRARLAALGVAPAELDRLEREAAAEVARAVEAARAAPLGGAAATLDPPLYATPLAALPADAPERRSDDPTVARPTPAGPAPGWRETSYSEALRQALVEELERDERVFLLGEDLGVYDGAFKVTRGLLARFGPERVRDTPISEAAIVAAAAGAALAGRRPVAELMFMDFLFLALDALANGAAKFHHVYAGQLAVPLVVRMPAGGYRGYGATHSQSLEARLLGIPGLKVVAPATPREARGLLKSAIRDDDPVVVVEHKLLYAEKGLVPEAEELVPLGRARLVRPGKDLTLVAHSYMVKLALAAAEALAAGGIEAEVLDLRSLVPLDVAAIAASAARTGRLVTVEEGVTEGGIGAEVAAAVQELAFGYLEAPILRVGARALPLPAAADQERAVLPGVAEIVAAARRVMEG